MEQNSHVRKVEKAMKEALKNDRARIQVGRISSFGLMEMSRQRLRTGVLEASTKPCPHCDGTGLMRTAASAGLSALRIIEDEAARGRGDRIVLRAGREAAVYVLNKKRAELAEIEQRYGVSIEVLIDESFEGARMTVESSGRRGRRSRRGSKRRCRRGRRRRRVDEEEAETTRSLEADEEDERGRGRERRTARKRARGRPRRAAGAPPPPRRPRPQAPRRRPKREAGRGSRGAADAAEPDERACAGAAERGRRARARQAPAPAPRRARPPQPSRRAAAVEPDSSPMVERPIDEEPPIAETARCRRAKPKPKRRRSKKAEAETQSVAEPAPAEPLPPAPPTRPRGPRSRRASAAQQGGAEPAQPRPLLNPSRRLQRTTIPRLIRRASRAAGWWQRTFG